MKKTYIVWFILFSIVLSSILFFVFAKDGWVDIKNNSIKNTDDEFVYDYINPEVVNENREIVGTFLANDVSSIYNRRSWIIKDILVDIWDKVSVWETLALVFDAWVEWEASASIYEKNTRVEAAKIDLENAKKEKKEKINELNKKLDEQYILLNEAQKNSEIEVKQVSNLKENTSTIESDTIWLKKQTIEVEKKSLQLFEKNLIDAELSKKSKLIDIENKKNQSISNSLIVINESFDKIIDFMYLWEDRLINNKVFSSDDISIYLSAKNSTVRNDFLLKVQWFYAENKTAENIDLLFKNLFEIYDLAPSAIDNTIVSSNISQASIDKYRTSIFSANKSLIDSESSYRNIIVSYDLILREQDEKINFISNNIEKQKEVILLAQKNLEISLNNQIRTNSNLENELYKVSIWQNSKIEAIKANIEVLKQSIITIETQEEKKIDSYKNNLNISLAEFEKTYSIFWNNKIISPFDWVISKRYINVWDMIWESSTIFDMVWVKNSLSKKAEKEVVFSIPKELSDSIKIWSEITFSQSESKSIAYTWSVWRISPQIDPLTNTIQVQAKVNNIELPHQTKVWVNLDTTKNYFRVPFSSIYEKENKKVVYFLRESWNLWYRYVNVINNIWEFVDIEWDNLGSEYKIITSPLFFD